MAQGIEPSFLYAWIAPASAVYGSSQFITTKTANKQTIINVNGKFDAFIILSQSVWEKNRV